LERVQKRRFGTRSEASLWNAPDHHDLHPRVRPYIIIISSSSSIIIITIIIVVVVIVIIIIIIVVIIIITTIT